MNKYLSELLWIFGDYHDTEFWEWVSGNRLIEDKPRYEPEDYIPILIWSDKLKDAETLDDLHDFQIRIIRQILLYDLPNMMYTWTEDYKKLVDIIHDKYLNP